MRKKFLNLAAALGLTAGLFVGALGGTSAAPEDVVGGSLYFPWVPNGETIAGLGPFDSEVTIQNTEAEAVDVDLMTVDGTIVQEFTLQAHASQTFSAADLGLPAQSGDALVAKGAVPGSETCTEVGMDTNTSDATRDEFVEETQGVLRGSADTADTATTEEIPIEVLKIVYTHNFAERIYDEGTLNDNGTPDNPDDDTVDGGDYAAIVNSAAKQITIVWRNGLTGNTDEPPPGALYQVFYSSPNKESTIAVTEETPTGVTEVSYTDPDTGETTVYEEATIVDDGGTPDDPSDDTFAGDYFASINQETNEITIDWSPGDDTNEPPWDATYQVTYSIASTDNQVQLTMEGVNGSNELPTAPVHTVYEVYDAGDFVNPDTGTTEPAQRYVEDEDYIVDYENGIIDWSPTTVESDEPSVGETYVVAYTTEDCTLAGAKLAGSVKMTAGSAVDGYAAVTAAEVDLAGGNWIVPIFQNRTGWDSALRIANVSGTSVSVTATYYDDNNATGLSVFNGTLAAGETQTIQASDVIPAESVGSVQIEASDAVVAVVNRIKTSPTMALTNVAQPMATDKTVDVPLVFKNYNNWNTGINIADTSGAANDVTVTFYDYNGSTLGRETVSIPANGMKFVYLLGTAGEGQVAAATISGTGSLTAAIDEVKYVGETQDVGHAMSYMSSGDHNELAGTGDTAAFPLIQRGNSDGTGATSGINLFNTGDATKVDVQFFDAAGSPVAPTRDATGAAVPVTVAVDNLTGVTIYTLTEPYSQLPEGFMGSATVTNQTAGAKISIMSNNVNYSVGGDGSAVFNGTAHEANADQAAQ